MQVDEEEVMVCGGLVIRPADRIDISGETPLKITVPTLLGDSPCPPEIEISDSPVPLIKQWPDRRSRSRSPKNLQQKKLQDLWSTTNKNISRYYIIFYSTFQK